jgi:hypothetical protein
MKRVFYFCLPEAFGLFSLFLFATPSYAALTDKTIASNVPLISGRSLPG